MASCFPFNRVTNRVHDVQPALGVFGPYLLVAYEIETIVGFPRKPGERPQTIPGGHTKYRRARTRDYVSVAAFLNQLRYQLREALGTEI